MIGVKAADVVRAVDANSRSRKIMKIGCGRIKFRLGKKFSDVKSVNVDAPKTHFYPLAQQIRRNTSP